MPIETAALEPDSLTDFLSARHRLLSIAQHIAGDFTDADDIVQEVWLRWQRTDRSDVVNPRAFLARTTSNLSLSTIQSARRRPTVPAGSWLEGLGEIDTDPARIAERSDDLRVAIGLLTSRLTPREQIVFVLREAFGWQYRQISTGLGLTEAHARQLSHRARKRLATAPDCPVSTTSPTARQRLLVAFQDAARTGDPAALLNLPGADR